MGAAGTGGGKSERQQPGEEPATAYVLDVNRILIWSKIKARLCHLPVPKGECYRTVPEYNPAHAPHTPRTRRPHAR